MSFILLFHWTIYINTETIHYSITGERRGGGTTMVHVCQWSNGWWFALPVHMDNSLTICMLLTCFSKCCWLVHQSPCHVLSRLYDKPCKRSLDIRSGCWAFCTVSRLQSVPIYPAWATWDVNMINIRKYRSMYYDRLTMNCWTCFVGYAIISSTYYFYIFKSRHWSECGVRVLGC